ncbi:MAG: 30S ribosomal protein S8 [Phycisphaerales bacterium]|nr:30S ribosomal protein S8 [Phycisphaerales bacterium]MCB9854840.1 30S ribosomal protein S8 [Phycisphaerales bacterium]
MWSDPVADMLTRIRNSARNKAKHVMIPRSNLKCAIAQVLKDEGFIEGFDEIDDGVQGKIRVALKYGPRGEIVLNELKRESKGGRRLFVGVDEIPQVLNGLGIAILSTSRGVLSDRKCREQRVGGELLCTVY